MAGKELLSRNELYEEAWQRPMIELGAKYGVSRATIKWACLQLRVPLPPLAYWIHRKRGHLLPRPPLPLVLPGQPRTISRATLVQQERPKRRPRSPLRQPRTEDLPRAMREHARDDELIAPRRATDSPRSTAHNLFASASMAMAMKPLFIDLSTVAASVSLSVASGQKLVREDRFPKPRLLSNRRVGWLVREVEEWAEARPLSDLLPPHNTGRRRKRESDEQ
jgi:prophage regulatory protein